MLCPESSLVIVDPVLANPNSFSLAGECEIVLESLSILISLPMPCSEINLLSLQNSSSRSRAFKAASWD